MYNLPHSLSFLDHRLTSHLRECWDPSRVLPGKVRLKAKLTYSSQMDLWTRCMVSTTPPRIAPLAGSLAGVTAFFYAEKAEANSFWTQDKWKYNLDSFWPVDFLYFIFSGHVSHTLKNRRRCCFRIHFMSVSYSWREQKVASTAIILRINCHSNKSKLKII